MKKSEPRTLVSGYGIPAFAGMTIGAPRRARHFDEPLASGRKAEHAARENNYPASTDDASAAMRHADQTGPLQDEPYESKSA